MSRHTITSQRIPVEEAFLARLLEHIQDDYVWTLSSRQSYRRFLESVYTRDCPKGTISRSQMIHVLKVLDYNDGLLRMHPRPVAKLIMAPRPVPKPPPAPEPLPVPSPPEPKPEPGPRTYVRAVIEGDWYPVKDAAAFCDVDPNVIRTAIKRGGLRVRREGYYKTQVNIQETIEYILDEHHLERVPRTRGKRRRTGTGPNRPVSPSVWQRVKTWFTS